MKFLLDENIPPSLCKVLNDLKQEAFHVRDKNLLSKPDQEIFDFAANNNFIIVTHDLDFSRIHAYSGLTKPSVILFRFEKINLKNVSDFFIQNLESITEDISIGAFVVIDINHIRIKRLPIKSVS